jgi:WD40 repeat protein
MLASGSGDGTVRLWDIAMRSKVATLEGHRWSVESLVFSWDGGTLASGSRDRTVRLWDVGTQREIAILKGHTNDVNSLAFSWDGGTLASGSEDGTVLLWDMSPYITPQSRDPDFDGDGSVGFSDFLQFAQKFGLREGDAGYHAKYDLDKDGAIGFGDFLEFANAYGQSQVTLLN